MQSFKSGFIRVKTWDTNADLMHDYYVALIVVPQDMPKISKNKEKET